MYWKRNAGSNGRLSMSDSQTIWWFSIWIICVLLAMCCVILSVSVTFILSDRGVLAAYSVFSAVSDASNLPGNCTAGSTCSMSLRTTYLVADALRTPGEGKSIWGNSLTVDGSKIVMWTRSMLYTRTMVFSYLEFSGTGG